MTAAATTVTATAAAVAAIYSAGKADGDPESGGCVGCCEGPTKTKPETQTKKKCP